MQIALSGFERHRRSSVLAHPIQHERPFPFFTCSGAFPAEVCEGLGRLFAEGKDWDHRDEGFYKCFLRDCTAEVSAELLRETAGRMREITGFPLTDEVQLTAQRVMPGQSIGVHSDRPLLGYEFARLVVHLNEGWRSGDGGLLQLFEQPDAAPALQLEPLHNVAFGFALHEDSHHAVSEVKREVNRVRRSVVFNFWHAANTADLERAVRTLFEGLHFSELPRALDTLVSAAESQLPEDTTHRAGVAALALHRWGYPVPIVAAGYRFSTDQSETAGLEDEARSAVRLADWVAGLYRGAFEPAAWRELRNALHDVGPFDRLQPLWSLCLP
jgi:hypothetical protein